MGERIDKCLYEMHGLQRALQLLDVEQKSKRLVYAQVAKAVVMLLVIGSCLPSILLFWC